MIKDILVCLEGSPSTEAATRIAIGVARACGAQMAGLVIIDEPDIRAGTPTSIGGASYKHERDETLVADAKKLADDWVALFERRCRTAGVPARSLEIVGRPAESILTEMEAHHLTVIGRDANFRFETEEHDRKTLNGILHQAMRPVLLVPETTELELGHTCWSLTTAAPPPSRPSPASRPAASPRAAPFMLPPWMTTAFSLGRCPSAPWPCSAPRTSRPRPTT